MGAKVTAAASAIQAPYSLARGKGTLDCSQFVCKAWSNAGIPVDPGMTTASMLADAKRDGRLFHDESQLQPGDAVLLDSGAGPNKMHTVLYMGNGMVRQESSVAKKAVDTKLSSIKYRRIGFVRPPRLRADNSAPTMADVL